MTAEIITFPPRAPTPEDSDYDPHGAGLARCICCKHEWHATAPVGTLWFECPSCGIHKGTWKYPYYTPVGSLYLACACDNWLFVITPDGVLCPNCGTSRGDT